MSEISARALPADLDAELVHRVLLTDPANFSSLRFSNLLPEGHRTPTFRQFQLSLDVKAEGGTDTDDGAPVDSAGFVSSFMKAAFRDIVVEQAENGNLQPATDLLLDLHRSIRKLIPSRTDLHSILDDSCVDRVATPQDLVPFLVTAAKAVEQLEAPVRSETTRSWIVEASQANPSDLSLDFIINSALYLLFKAELCECDKKDFYLSTVWAPMIHERGTQLTQAAFECVYGSLSLSTTAPLTRKWLKQLTSSQQPDDTLTDGKHLLFRGWLDILLGGGADMGLPEIFALDVTRLESIRQVTRVAAAGSAIVLYATQVAGVAQSRVSEVPESTRNALVLELNKHHVSSQTSQAYIERVVTFVTTLVREWNPNVDFASSELIRQKTTRVLRGEDAVIQVYVSRIKKCFWEIILRAMENPLSLRSGVASVITRAESNSTHFQEIFDQRGLSLFASDLAEAAWMAFKIIELAWNVYGNVLVQPSISVARKGS